MRSRKLRLTLDQRLNLWGYLFVSPFILGFTVFFVYPFAQSILFSLSKLEITPTGYSLASVGLKNYRDIFGRSLIFAQLLTGCVRELARDVPLIVVFSFFAATLLNSKFRGRTVARAIFFLPVIVGAGVVLNIDRSSFMMNALNTGGESGIFGATAALKRLLFELQLPKGLADYVVDSVNAVPTVIRSSGIQVLIFLAGLQSLSESLYEAADIEGATAWESFWKITFPLMTPLIVVNIVYTIVDTFTNPTNAIISHIQTTTFNPGGFGIGSAMAWVYFAIVSALIAATIGIVSRGVFYRE